MAEAVQGKLVLIGGDEDKRDGREILRRLVLEASACSVAVITTASSIPQELGELYRQVFGSLGVERIQVLDIRYRDEAERPACLEAVGTSDVIFFSGGDQHQLVTILEGTALLREIRRRLAEGAVIAGTSAGAAAAGEITIFNGDQHGLIQGAVRHCPGFGFLKGVIVDTHFVERGRIYRLAGALAAGLCPRGIGLAEDTALLVHPGGLAEVLGRGPVTVLDAAPLRSTNALSASAGEAVTLDGLRLGFLQPGTRFHLDTWAVVDGDGRPDIPETAAPGRRKTVAQQVRALFKTPMDPDRFHPDRR